jgi:methylenetetrahydrofolate reductase (NADPH)
MTAVPAFSFEFFPPKTEALEQSLWQAVGQLAALKPAFVSVTYGAGGSTRARTHEIVTHLQERHGLAAAAHLTCVGATREEIDEIARSYWEAGIRHLVALRGDPPAGSTGYAPTPGGYAYAADLVEGLKRVAPFEISVAAYPETHPEAISPEADLENLKRKVEAGAVRAITQFFFDTDAFFRFRDKAVKAGIKVPVIPGILPVSNFARAVDFARRCGTSVPDSIHTLFRDFDTLPTLVRQKLAEDVAVEQCLALKAGGVEQFHFYTLNRAELVTAICGHLGQSVSVDETPRSTAAV